MVRAMGMLFFFSSRRRHTRWNCDWSSDVCSSDLVGTLTLHAPLADCLDLGGRHFLVDLGIAVFSAAEEALQEFAPGGLARFRVGEVDLQPELLRYLVGGA